MTPGRSLPRGTFAWTAVIAAVAVAATSLRNGFAYDDLPLIVENDRVTGLLSPWSYFGQSYWPAGGLYRPLAVWLLALQWHLGGGAPWIFHATNVALHALVTGLVFLLARRVLAPPWAGLAALLFAVHPVHVEAVANVVGVSELLCAVFVLSAVLVAMTGVTSGFTPARRLGVVALGMAAALSKEQGFMTPALILAAASLIPVPSKASALRKVTPVACALAVLLLALLLFRASVLGGLAGDEPAAPLRALTPSARMLASLGTVPDWIRLLLWPERLSFDYSPPGYPVATVPGTVHALALFQLTALGWVAWVCRRAAPAVTLGIAWSAIALVPVSNFLVPTGVVLAERTLYLASVGAVLALAGIAAHVGERLPSPTSRGVATAAVAAILIVAAMRSSARAAVWKDNETLMQQVEREAPDNYRAHRTRALHLERQGRLDDAAREFRRSIALWNHDPRVYENLAILLDRQGHDGEALAVLREGLTVDPAAPAMRSKRYFLEAARGEWLAARATAEAGLAFGDTMFAPLVRRADSALAAAATSTPVTN